MKALLSRLRKSREAADPALEAPAKRQPGGVSIPKLSLGAFVAATLVVVGTTFVAYSQYADTAADGRERQSRLEAQRLADFLAGRIQGYRDLLTGIAARGPLDSGQLARYAEAIPGSPGLRRLPPGFQEPDSTSEPPVSYACIDLVNISTAGGTAPPAEVHLVDQPGAHLVIAASVGADGEAGTLLLTFKPSIIERWAAPLSGSSGFVELRQGVNGKGPRLVAIGNASLRGATAPQVIPVSGTSWELSYWPEPTTAMAAEAGYLLLAGVTTGALALIFLVLGVTTSRLVGGDLARFNGHIGNLLARKREHAYTVKLAEFRRAVGELDEIFRGASARSGPRASAPRPSAKPVAPVVPSASGSDDDSPDVVFMRKDAFTVTEDPVTEEDGDGAETSSAGNDHQREESGR